jgi:uncharacterized cupredoxin-like copper-binding protein
MKRLLPLILVTGSVSSGFLSLSSASAGSPKEQKISVRMTDIAYSARSVKVKKGVPVVFTFMNKGNVVHEAVIGVHAEQVAHDKEMAAMGGMVMADEPTAIQVKPGASKSIRFTFKQSGTYEIGCHIPGHYKAGMKIDVTVA